MLFCIEMANVTKQTEWNKITERGEGEGEREGGEINKLNDGRVRIVNVTIRYCSIRTSLQLPKSPR